MTPLSSHTCKLRRLPLLWAHFLTCSTGLITPSSQGYCQVEWGCHWSERCSFIHMIKMCSTYYKNFKTAMSILFSSHPHPLPSPFSLALASEQSRSIPEKKRIRQRVSWVLSNLFISTSLTSPTLFSTTFPALMSSVNSSCALSMCRHHAVYSEIKANCNITTPLPVGAQRVGCSTNITNIISI